MTLAGEFEIRVRGCPEEKSTPWEPMLGWRVHQTISIISDGLYDGIEIRKADGPTVLLMGIRSGRTLPIFLPRGDQVHVTPGNGAST